MLLTGTTQSVAFLISAWTPMPGVRAFSLYASAAIILNFLMQITCFVVLLTLDAKREHARRLDLCCFIKLNARRGSKGGERGARRRRSSSLAEAEAELDMDFIKAQKSYLYKFFKHVYTPLLFRRWVRASVIVVFVGFFFACIAMCDKLKVGLDQKLAMPSDSYQIAYFEALQRHLQVGPPVYFVLKDDHDYDYTSLDGMRRLCGSPTCYSDSLQSLISAASMRPNETYIAAASVNWLDDYIEWLNADPLASTCCFALAPPSSSNYSTTYASESEASGQWCDPRQQQQQQQQQKQQQHQKSNAKCEPCRVHRRQFGMPTAESMLEHVAAFLRQNPSRDCVKAGHAMYGDAVKLKTIEKATISNKNQVNIPHAHSPKATTTKTTQIGRKFRKLCSYFTNSWSPIFFMFKY